MCFSQTLITQHLNESVEHNRLFFSSSEGYSYHEVKDKGILLHFYERETYIRGHNKIFDNRVLPFYAKPILQHTFLMKEKINKPKTYFFFPREKAIRKYKSEERKKLQQTGTITSIIRKSIKSNLLLRQQVYSGIVTDYLIITKKSQ